MIDHIGLAVTDLARAKAFYARALEPLGMRLLMDFPSDGSGAAAGFGDTDHAEFWIGDGKPADHSTHVAFRAADRAAVDAFHAAALEAGGSDNGAPGLRPYHENYYGAFVFDPDGNNIEAVCHDPE